MAEKGENADVQNNSSKQHEHHQAVDHDNAVDNDDAEQDDCDGCLDVARLHDQWKQYGNYLLHNIMINFSGTLALFRFPMMMMRITSNNDTNAWS